MYCFYLQLELALALSRVIVGRQTQYLQAENSTLIDEFWPLISLQLSSSSKSQSLSSILIIFPEESLEEQSFTMLASMSWAQAKQQTASASKAASITFDIMRAIESSVSMIVC